MPDVRGRSVGRHFAAAEVETPTAFAITGTVRLGRSRSQGYIVRRLLESSYRAVR